VSIQTVFHSNNGDEGPEGLWGGLHEHAAEIEAQILGRARVAAGEELAVGTDGDRELQALIRERIYLVLMSADAGRDWTAPVPSTALAQVRRAARAGMPLDIVLHRVTMVDNLLAESILDRFESIPPDTLRLALRSSWQQVENLMALLAAEYVRELDRSRSSSEARREHRIHRLLQGEAPAHDEDLGYELTAWHVGLVVGGPEAARQARELSTRLGLGSIVVERSDRIAWVWLGAAAPVRVEKVEEVAGRDLRLQIAIGECRRGLCGWRLTHSEALAAFQVMSMTDRRVARIRDVALLAAVLRDPRLTQSLLETYVTPLGGEDSALRTTVKAYLDSAFNTASAAAVIGVDRHTVQRRLRRVEQILGRPLSDYQAEMKVALELEEVTDSQP
jgi:PucR C-terminal helix-turn-helix domain/GGDEF-like domain